MDTKDSILTAAISVFGRYGFKKTSVEDIAAAAQLSKQGLYLHFDGKQEIFIASFRKYLEEGLQQVQTELSSPAPLYDRLHAAMDAWFGRHLTTFSPESFDIIEASRHLSGNLVDTYKEAFRGKIAKALAESPEFKKAKNICSPKEISLVLYTCGISWKADGVSRAEFMKKMGVCIRASCQIE